MQRLKGRWDLIAIALMLEFLHFSIQVDFGSLLSRSLMLSHLGLFLIWQPVWRSDERISWQNALTFIVLTLAFVAFLNWALLFAWLILLSGFAGGRVVNNPQERNTYLLVLLFLTLELIIECTPTLFRIPIRADIKYLFSIVLPLLPLLVTTMPRSSDDHRIQSVDILHALSTSTLIGILIFGSLLNMYVGGTAYLIALMQTLIAIALFLFAISWLLSPKTGFSGLSQLWSKALLNIGTPFEQWLTNLSGLFQQQQTPTEFLEAAMEELLAMPWVAGVKWQAGESPGSIGDTGKHETEFRTNNFSVSIFSKNWLGGVLYLHCNLLIQLIDIFYLTKIRERQLTQQAQLKAIHETGARVTHDIKNLLQSLHAITNIIQYEQTEPEAKSVSHRLLERQMPHLTQRLQLALDKLQAPDKHLSEKIYLNDWWYDFTGRNEMKDIEFHSSVAENILVPAELLDSVIENMFENLREKKRLDSNLRIRVELLCNAVEFRLSISDNGKKIPDSLVNSLLKEPVKSDNGLGIGLYQVTRLAELSGYTFALKENSDGNVCFELSKENQQDVLDTLPGV